MPEIIMNQISADKYVSDCGYNLEREYGLSPNGYPLNGKWVLRDPTGKMLDFDKYRYDIEEYYNLKLISC